MYQVDPFRLSSFGLFNYFKLVYFYRFSIKNINVQEFV